jgi:hypothetical protein
VISAKFKRLHFTSPDILSSTSVDGVKANVITAYAPILAIKQQEIDQANRQAELKRLERERVEAERIAKLKEKARLEAERNKPSWSNSM